MLQLDQIRFRIKTYNMRTGNETCPSGGNVEHVGINLSIGWFCQNLFFSIDILSQYMRQRKRSPARAIRLLAMMYFVDVRVIVCDPVHENGSLLHNPEKDIHTQRKIRG